MPSRLQQLGDAGEDIARKFLEKKAFRFKESKWHSRYGEIDLIMWDEDELVFIEVKMRRNHRYGRPEEMVSSAKSKRICKTAWQYLQKHHLMDVFWRFDTVAITGHTENHQILHLRDVIRDE